MVFRLFANGKTFAPSASEVKAHDLRGLNSTPTIKSFLRAFFQKSENIYLTNYLINQNLNLSYFRTYLHRLYKNLAKFGGKYEKTKSGSQAN